MRAAHWLRVPRATDYHYRTVLYHWFIVRFCHLISGLPLRCFPYHSLTRAGLVGILPRSFANRFRRRTTRTLLPHARVTDVLPRMTSHLPFTFLSFARWFVPFQV